MERRGRRRYVQSVTIEVVYQSWDVYTEKVKGQHTLMFGNTKTQMGFSLYMKDTMDT